MTWRRLRSGCGYLRIAAWLRGRAASEIDAALRRAARRGDADPRPPAESRRQSRPRRCHARSVPAGSDARSARSATASAEASCRGAFPLVAEPPEAAARWPGRLVVLVDELTFSSSEDFLLGLQGLDARHASSGRPSGGGSGRPRSVRLLPGWTLTVSTALTYDRNGRCIEGAGIPVDVPVPLRLDGERDACSRRPSGWSRTAAGRARRARAGGPRPSPAGAASRRCS